MLKKILASAALAAALIIPMDAKAQWSGWQSCGFIKTQGSNRLVEIDCYRVSTGPYSYELHWADGGADKFTVIRNGLVQDSTGTYWDVTGRWYKGNYYIAWISRKNGSGIMVLDR